MTPNSSDFNKSQLLFYVTVWFSTEKSRALPRDCTSLFRSILRINSDYFLESMKRFIFVMEMHYLDKRETSKPEKHRQILCLYIKPIQKLFFILKVGMGLKISLNF